MGTLATGGKMSMYHTPVLLHLVIEKLQVAAGKRYIDATLGGGGHTKAMVALGADVLAIDQDKEAIEENKGVESPHCRIVHGNFRNIEKLATEIGWKNVDGVLFDLGVSSHQLDSTHRGFSYRYDDAPLDMRMGEELETHTGADIVNIYSEDELFNIFATFGEIPEARGIARDLVKARKKQRIETVGQLIHSISVHTKGNRDMTARVFQALRIVVNDELGALKEALTGALHLVRPGGKIAVISFHSLEDRIVKRFFSQDCFRLEHKKPFVADEQEQRTNSRSRSAKLRIAERIW